MSEGLYVSSDDPVISYSYRLTGEEMSDNERHLIARVKFLNNLSEEPRVLACYRGLADGLGISEACLEATTALDSIARALGFDHRGEMFHAEELHEELVQKISDALIVFLEEAIFSRRAAIITRLVALVRDELKQPWSWVVMSLFEHFIRDVFYYLLGWEVPDVFFSIGQAEESQAPTIDLIFGTMPDESAADAAKRLTSLYFDTMRKLVGVETEDSRPKRKHSPIGPKNPNGETMTKYAHWYYLNKVQGVSPYRIAKTEDIDKNLVTYGIRQAETALGYASISMGEKT